MRIRIVLSNFFILLACLVLFLSGGSIIISSINETTTHNELQNYLEVACRYFDGSNADDLGKLLTFENDYLRVSVIGIDGDVIYDNFEDESTMENHLSRPEISSLGSFQTRYSDTLEINMVYLARLDDGYYVRLAIPVSIVDDIIYGFNLYSIIALLILLILSSISMLFLTKTITKPITLEVRRLGEVLNMNLDIKDDDVKTLSKQIEMVREELDSEVKKANIEKNKVDYIINNIQEGLIILNAVKEVVLINKVALSGFELKSEEVLNKNYLYLFRNNEIVNFVDEAFDKKANLSKEIKLNGKNYLFEFNYLNEDWNKKNDGGSLSIIMIDVTKLDEVQKMKRDFFANASHELKSPLTSIIGNLQLLDQNFIKTKKEKDEVIKSSIKEAKRMSKIISDMLELSYLEGKEKVRVENLKLDSFINSIVERYQPTLKEKNIKLNLNLIPAEILIEANDADYLFSNLIDNAIKYTNSSGIINIELLENHLVIEDNGIGIAKEDQERIFERFYRVDKARSKELGGTGLGLSIVKHICVKYGYKIEVNSEINKGTKFTIIFK